MLVERKAYNFDTNQRIYEGKVPCAHDKIDVAYKKIAIRHVKCRYL